MRLGTALAVGLALALAGCQGPSQIALHYSLGAIDPTQVVRVQTVVGVAAPDTRAFYAIAPYRSVSQGVGYEVRDLDGSGVYRMLITHDATLGYVFQPTFTFTLLPPSGEPAPPLTVSASAAGANGIVGEALPFTAMFAVDGQADVTMLDRRCGGVEVCGAGETCCNGACVSTDTDGKNCGACGHGCGDAEACLGAVCRCAGGSTCSGGMSCCPTGCLDLSHDAFNCGSCGHACNIGEACVNGACACAATGKACADGAACCASGCTQPGIGCPCGAKTCSISELCCGGACVDPRSSDANCGACSNSCSRPLACSNGACACQGVVCSAGDSCCMSGCSNTRTDVFNCGGCGRVCATGESCDQGSCTCAGTTCAQGQICCPSAADPTGAATIDCTDPMNDERNCGFCGNRCGTGERCVAGKCSCAGGAACVGNQTCCAGANGGGCFDLSSDPAHCMACDAACAGGQACMQGQCVSSVCSPPCTNGNSCDNNQCDCNGAAACAGAQTCCPTVGCVDLLNDPKHCGGCGKVCGAGQLCCNGACTPQDSSHCGGCTSKCGGISSCCVCPGKPGTCTTLICSCP